MTSDVLEQDLRALLASLDDRAEADALRELITLATELEFDPGADDDYTPFVYPH